MYNKVPEVHLTPGTLYIIDLLQEASSHYSRNELTVPLLYQIGMEHHVFSWRIMHPENQESQPILTFMKTNSASLTYEIRASALNTKFHFSDTS